MKKSESKGKILGAVAIAAGAALIGRIIYDFKKIRELTKEEALAGDTEEVKETTAEENEAPVAEEPVAEATEAPAEPTEDAKAE